MIVELSRQYPSRFGLPVIHRVDTNIFTRTYFAHCMQCTFCHDSCCQYGATVEEPLVQKLLANADALEPYVGFPRERWFQDGMLEDTDYPGGRTTRTQVIDGACVFLNRNGRGCLLHRYCLEHGIEVHELKPFVCHLFPVGSENATLVQPLEVEDETLVCLGDGPVLYRSAREDIRFYFGDELIAELDAIEARALAEAAPVPVGRVSLPLVPEVPQA